MNNKVEEVKAEPIQMDIDDAIAQKIKELQMLVSQLKDYGCLVLYAYDSDQDDDKGFVKGMIDGKGVMVKKALEKLAKNDESFRHILAGAYLDSMPDDGSILEQMMQLITSKGHE